MECLAAQIVGTLKNCVGNVYLSLDHESFDKSHVEYLYFLSPNEDGRLVDIRVEHRPMGDVLFDGTVDEFHRVVTGPLGVSALWNCHAEA
jgi:hypothetical protein